MTVIAEGSQNSCTVIAYPLRYPQAQEIYQREGHGCTTDTCNRSTDLISCSFVNEKTPKHFLTIKEQPGDFVDMKYIKSPNDSK